MAHVVVEELDGNGVECLLDGGDLGEDVDAVAIVVNHLCDPANLAFDPRQTLSQWVFAGGVAAGLGVLCCRHSRDNSIPWYGIWMTRTSSGRRR